MRYTDKEGNSYLEHETIVKSIHSHNTDFEGRITKRSYEASVWPEDWTVVRPATFTMWEDALGNFYPESGLEFTGIDGEIATASVDGKVLILKQVSEARFEAIEKVTEWLRETYSESLLLKAMNVLKRVKGYEDYSEAGDNKAVDTIMERVRTTASLKVTEISWRDFAKAMSRAFPDLSRKIKQN
jgi:hypothetical protein